MRARLAKGAWAVSFGLAAAMGYELMTTESTAETRKRLITTRAKGRVLETCVGAQAKNLPWYDFSKVTELVLVEASPQAAEKLKRECNAQIKLHVTNTLRDFPSDSFDTVVDTLGICSLEQPVEYLAEMKRVLKPSGEALFMEHGRREGVEFSLVNLVLDLVAPLHFSLQHCHCNRSISALVEQAGFTIESKQVTLFGTSTVLVAKKA